MCGFNTNLRIHRRKGLGFGPTGRVNNAAPPHPELLSRTSVVIDDDREWLESGRGSPPALRPEILTSWRRSRLSGVDPEHLSIGQGMASVDSKVARAGIPILRAAADLLIGADTALLLSSPEGTVLWRWSESGRLDALLNRSSVVVGARMSEDVAGTNGIGTSLETARPVVISGPEHFTEALHAFTCAGAPILDPITHRVVGTLSVTSLVEQSGPLMKTVLQKLIKEIEDQLLEDSTGRERELLRQFREQRRLGRSPVVVFNSDMMITDRAGATAGVDLALLWERLEAGIAQDEKIDLGSADKRVTLTGSTIGHRGSTLGVIFAGDPPKAPVSPIGLTGSTGWTSRPVDPCWADLVDRLSKFAVNWDRILIIGESGVGKRTMARQVLDKPPCPLLELDCVSAAETGGRQWLATVRKMLSDGYTNSGQSLLVSHLDSLSSTQARALGQIFDQLPREVDGARIIGTYTPATGEPHPSMQALLDRFHSEHLDIPPLRRRQADILKVLSGQGVAHPGLSDEVLEQLRHHPWPGNYRQLGEFRRWLERQQRPVIGVHDLPPGFSRGAIRGRLTAIQAAEADAIELALLTSRGNKSAAAAALGLARSSLYRKMREYRLT